MTLFYLRFCFKTPPTPPAGLPLFPLSVTITSLSPSLYHPHWAPGLSRCGLGLICPPSFGLGHLLTGGAAEAWGPNLRHGQGLPAWEVQVGKNQLTAVTYLT